MRTASEIWELICIPFRYLASKFDFNLLIGLSRDIVNRWIHFFRVKIRGVNNSPGALDPRLSHESPLVQIEDLIVCIEVSAEGSWNCKDLATFKPEGMDKQRLIKKMDLVQIVSVTSVVQTPFIWIIDHYLASIIVDISSFGFRH